MADILHKLINTIINLEGTEYNVDDIQEETLKKASEMSFAIGRALRNEIEERKLNNYCGENTEGKYVILKKPGDKPVYMLVRSAFITSYYSSSHKCVCFQGTGFYFNLNSPYSDNNYSSFSTWEDVYIKLDDLEKEGCITEISKEEFENTFQTMLKEMSETFNKWKSLTKKIKNKTID